LPGLKDREPDRGTSQDLGHVPRVAADKVEKPTFSRSRRDSGGLCVATLQDRKLLELEPKLLEPPRGVLDGNHGALACGCRRHYKRRPRSGRRGEHSVLLLVARIELVSTDQRDHASASAHGVGHPHIERELQS
jgi:hypothetical protein